MSELPPLSDDLAELVAVDRELPPVPAASHDRILAGVERDVVAGPSGASPVGGPGTAETGGLLSRWAGPFIFGTVFGALVTLAVTYATPVSPPEPAPTETPTSAAPTFEEDDERRPVEPETTTEDESAAEPSQDLAQPIELEAVPPPPAIRALRTTETRTTETIEPPSGLAAELLLIDSARAAVRAGHVAEAARILNRHALEFPDGQLTAERERLQQQLAAAVEPELR